MGRHTLKTWSATQKKVTLSSGEDQLVAMVKMSCEMIGMTQLASEWGLAMKGNVFAGSSVALGIAEEKRKRKDETCQDWDPLDSREKSDRTTPVHQGARGQQSSRPDDEECGSSVVLSSKIIVRVSLLCVAPC